MMSLNHSHHLDQFKWGPFVKHLATYFSISLNVDGLRLAKFNSISFVCVIPPECSLCCTSLTMPSNRSPVDKETQRNTSMVKDPDNEETSTKLLRD